MSTKIYHELNMVMEAGERAAVVTRLIRGQGQRQSCEKWLYRQSELNQETETGQGAGLALRALEEGKIQVEQLEGETRYAEPCFPEPRLIVLGGGHIAKPLVELGSKAGFQVTVVDDRLSFANPPRFPLAEQVICDSFETVFPRLKLSGACYVVIVTRGHRHDYVCLTQTLTHETAYTGMIGSKKRVAMVREQLLEEGYAPEKIAKVVAPIGLNIGAVTPDEIAIAIIAQVISYRRQGADPEAVKGKKKTHWPEFDREVLAALQEQDQAPKALVTILSTKGSVPRKAGAKMLVWPNGKIVGSIGGGCSEADVIAQAYQVIDSGLPVTMKVDLTGEQAEEEGMVCGGIMEVAIEPWQ